jgi:hypothetical protein
VFWASPKHEYAQEQFMKRKGLLLLVLATLAAGGAFAQKVGDTGDFMGKNYTVQEVRDGSVLLQLTPTLNGTWKGETGHVVTFNGNAAVFKQISPDVAWQDAIKKKYVKVGDQAYNNLKKTGDLTWSGQNRTVSFNPNTPDVAIGTNWKNCTITLSPDGKTFQFRGASNTENQYVTYTRQ